MSGNRFLLDTNIVVPFLNGDQEILDRFKQLPEINIPFLSLGELYYGAHKSSKTVQNLEKIKLFIESHCNVIHSSELTTEFYGELKNELLKQGTPIPENDIWIASLSREHSFTLVTRDKHFKNITDLNLVKW